MKVLFGFAVLAVLFAVRPATAEDKFPQLDILEHPAKVVQDKTELEPYEDVVVLFSPSRDEIGAALRTPDEILKRLPEDQRFYLLTVNRSALKDIKELRELARAGKLPVIHIGYKIEKNVRAPLLLLPTGLLEVEVTSAADVEKLEKLAKDLNLVVADKQDTAVLLQLAGKSKYDFVFDVASAIAKADFVKAVKPMAPMMTRSGDETKRLPRGEESK